MLKDAGYLWEVIGFAGRRRFFIVMSMVVVMALLETAGVLSVTPFLAVLGNPDLIYRHPVAARISEFVGVDDVRDFLVLLGAFSIMVVVASALFKTVTLHSLRRYAHFQRFYIGTHLLGTYLQLPYAFHLKRNSSDLTKTMISEVDQLVSSVLQPFMQMLAHGVVVVAMIVVLLAYDVTLAVVVAGCVGAFYGVIYLVVRGILDRNGSERHAANRERYRAAAEALGGVKEVKVMDASAIFVDRFARASRQFSRHLATSETLSQSPLYLVECLGFSVIIGMALILMLRGGDLGEILPALGLYAFAAYRMLPAAQTIYRGIARMRAGAAALRHLHGEIALAERQPSATETGGVAPLRLERAISLCNVSFGYGGDRRSLSLAGIDLEILANTSVGIIGATGSGKSTLIDVLLGLLAPDSGEVRLDGVPLTPEIAPAWRSSIGYVPQQIFLTDSTLAENIAFGIPAPRIDMEQVEYAARSAQLHDFVNEALPLGYRTVIGERGVRISGGERQRLGLARALYRNPAVLLLDEATSALDVATEASVLSAMNGLKGTRTIIMVAHRLSTVEGCDEVVLLDRGRIAMAGSPSAVIARASETWHSDQRPEERVRSVARPAC